MNNCDSRFWFKGGLIWLPLFSLTCVFLCLSGCTVSVEHPPVSGDRLAVGNRTVLVMGVKWVETFNDTEDNDTLKVMRSRDLLEDAERIEENTDPDDSHHLFRPLYYLFNFRLGFRSQEGQRHLIQRFDRDLRTWRPIAVHDFLPGRFQLATIELDHLRFELSGAGDDSVDRWKRFHQWWRKDIGQWEVPPGQIVYLGDITFHFRSRRFVFGLLMKEEVVAETRLTGISLADRFNQTRDRLKEIHPGFPVEEMVNLAADETWIYDRQALKEERTAIERGNIARPEAVEDKKKYFF